MGSSLTQFIRSEIIGREFEFIATVISEPQLIHFDLSGPSESKGAPTWVVDLEIGGNRPALNIPIKASGSGSNFYAQLGQTVKVRRTALGRMFVVGPGDTTIATKNTNFYDLVTQSTIPDSTQATGFSRQILPFEFYMGPTAMKGNPVVDFNVIGGDDTIFRESGDFVVDGFLAGQTVQVGGSSSNDGTVLLSNVTTTTLSTTQTLVDEQDVSNVTIGVLGTSLWNDPAGPFFPFSRIIDGDGNPV